MREKLVAHRAAVRLVDLAMGGAGRRRRRAAGRRRPEGPVRILMSNAYGAGGTMRTVFTLAGHLARRHDVEVVSLVRDRDEPFFALPAGVRLRVLDDRRPGARRPPLGRLLAALPSALMHLDDAAYPSYSLLTDLHALRAVRAQRRGVLIATRPAFNLLAARFARPEVVVVGQEHMNLGALGPDLPADVARDYPGLDAVAVLTRADEEDYRRLLAGAATRVVRLPNAVPDVPGEPAAERTRVVLAAGRLIRQKGFDLLVEAAAPALGRHADWEVRVHGEGKRRAELEALIAERGLEGRFVLAGPTAQLGELMARGAIFALSSRYEGLPMVLIEAMSKGMAVVAFDCPTGPGEVIEHDRDGVLVPAEDVTAFSDALLALIEDEERRRRLGSAARRTALRYDREAIGARWEELLAGLGVPGADGAPASAAPEQRVGQPG